MCRKFAGMRTGYALLFIGAIGAQSRAATFTINYNGVPTDAQTCITYAANIWSGILVSDVPIKLLVSWLPLGTSTLGITFPNGRRDFANAPLDSTWYATSLANSIGNVELNPGENDIEIFLSSSANWYTGIDGNPAAGQYDLASIVLHEICHGLGFVGLSKKVGGDGSFGLLLSSDFSPLFTTFPWPQLDTLPSAFDRHLENNASNLLTDLVNPSTQLGAALSNNQVYFSGPLTNIANGGSHARVYAPSTFALGSSCVHLNESTYPAGNVNELMTPFSSAGVANHWPGPVCLGILRDIGWTLAPDVGITETVIDGDGLVCYPNPATTELWMRTGDDFGRGTVVISDPSGRPVMAARDHRSLDISVLADGIYIVIRTVDGSSMRGRFIKDQ